MYESDPDILFLHSQYHNSTDVKNPQMCYHLRSCVPKLVKRSECPLEKNNYIDHRWGEGHER